MREQNQIIGILVIATDVTSRRRAEAAAQTAERALLTLMNSLPGMAYRGPLARQRQMDLVNNGAWDLTGFEPDSFMIPSSIPYGSLIHADDQDFVWQELQMAVQERRAFELQYRIRTAEGQIKWVLERGSGLFASDGKLLAVEGFISDITERVLAQQILEQRIVDRTQKLSAMYEMMTVVSEQTDLKTSLRRALSWVLTAVHGQSGFVQLLDASKQLHLAVQVGLSKKTKNLFQEVSPDSGLWNHVLSTRKPFAAADSQAADLGNSLLQQTNFHAYAGLPMTGRGKIIGVLNVWRKTNRPFSESDVALMAAAAEQMGTTIENARLRRDNNRLLLLEERNRLARELHDAVTQSLYSLTLFAETNQRFAKMGDLDNVQQYSQRITATAEGSLKEMRLLLHNLRPSILQHAGLSDAIRQRLDAVEKRAGVQTRLICDENVTLPAHLEETLFHIAEEALNNSLKHAHATAVSVEINQTDALVTLSVRDNGHGFDKTHLPDTGGFGLASMQERTEMLGGKLTIISQSGETAVTVTFDLEQGKDATASQNLLDLLQD